MDNPLNRDEQRIALKRDPRIRSELCATMAHILRCNPHITKPEQLADTLLAELEKLGWHGVKEESGNKLSGGIKANTP